MGSVHWNIGLGIITVVIIVVATPISAMRRSQVIHVGDFNICFLRFDVQTCWE